MVRYEDGGFRRANDFLVEERLAEIYVGGELYVSVMATPDQLDHLAVGCLFTEGAIGGIADVKSVSVDGLKVRVELRTKFEGPPVRARSSGFGLGSVAVGDIAGLEAARAGRPTIMAGMIPELMEEFNRRSELFRKTGAVHSAWLLKGERGCFAEDVGRHNALDKVIGRCLREGAAAGSGEAGLLFTTGRISAEMLLKAARAGVDALVSRGSASRLAVELAEKFNLTLIGFARGDSFKAFHGGESLAGRDERGASDE